MGNIDSNWKKDVWQYWTPEAKKDWPIDTESYVYLCRAIDPVGVALFGAQWLGTEAQEFADISVQRPIAREVLIHIEQNQATDFQREQVFFLLRDRFGTHAELPASPKIPMGAALWRLGCQLAGVEDGRRRQARDRARAVIEAIRDAILKKALGFGLREIPGGSITKHEPFQPLSMADIYWNGENLTPRLAYGQINLMSPFGDRPKFLGDKNDLRSNSWNYIYLDRQGLARLVRTIRESRPQVSAELQPAPSSIIEVAPLAHTLENSRDNEHIDFEIKASPGMATDTEANSGPKRLAVLAAAEALFPDGLPPAHLMPKQIVRQSIANWIQKHTQLGIVSDRTISDSLKLYSSEKNN